MTRLVEADICQISHRLMEYNKKLQAKVGGSLAEIGAAAAGKSVDELLAAGRNDIVGIVPLTSGEGIIGGFSQTIQSIIEFIGLKTFITEHTDVAGMTEAVERGATLLFVADDLTCSLLDLRNGNSADNSVCTGKGFAAALAMKVGKLAGRRAVVLGAGPVGCGAVQSLLEHGAEVTVYDILPEKLKQFEGRAHVSTAGSLKEALASGDIYFEATTATNTIQLADMNENTVAAAPGVPLGVAEAAVEKYGNNIINDVLEIGIVTMVFTILSKK